MFINISKCLGGVCFRKLNHLKIALYTITEIQTDTQTLQHTLLGISWTLYCLAKHPIHQEKCRLEIQSVLNGRDGFEW